VSVPTSSESQFWAYANDLYVFQVDTTGEAAHLDLLGTIEHDDSVMRSVQIGDRLISISEDSIEVHELTNPELVLATLSLTDLSSIPPIDLPYLTPPPAVIPPVDTVPIWQPVFGWPIDIMPITWIGEPIEITSIIWTGELRIADDLSTITPVTTLTDAALPILSMPTNGENRKQAIAEEAPSSRLAIRLQALPIQTVDTLIATLNHQPGDAIIHQKYIDQAMTDSLQTDGSVGIDTLDSLSDIAMSSNINRNAKTQISHRSEISFVDKHPTAELADGIKQHNNTARIQKPLETKDFLQLLPEAGILL
jgi:hypothetical protein